MEKTLSKQEYIEREVAQWEERNSELPPHNKSILRSMSAKEWEHWESEEGRVLKNSNRYHDDN